MQAGRPTGRGQDLQLEGRACGLGRLVFTVRTMQLCLQAAGAPEFGLGRGDGSRVATMTERDVSLIRGRKARPTAHVRPPQPCAIST